MPSSDICSRYWGDIMHCLDLFTMMQLNPKVPITMASPMKVCRRMTSCMMFAWDSIPSDSSVSSDNTIGAWNRDSVRQCCDLVSDV